MVAQHQNRSVRTPDMEFSLFVCVCVRVTTRACFQLCCTQVPTALPRLSLPLLDDRHHHKGWMMRTQQLVLSLPLSNIIVFLSIYSKYSSSYKYSYACFTLQHVGIVQEKWDVTDTHTSFDRTDGSSFKHKSASLFSHAGVSRRCHRRASTTSEISFSEASCTHDIHASHKMR